MTEAFVEDVGRETVYRVFEQQDSYGCREHVEVPTETLLRWQHAQRAWDAAQAEMTATYAASAALAAAVEQVETDLEAEEWARERTVQEAERALIEAHTEEVDGPREFLVVERYRWDRRGFGRTWLASTVHRESCPAVAKARERDQEGEVKPHEFGSLIRKPEAASALGPNGVFRNRVTQPCQRCCRDLEQVSARMGG